MATHVPLCVIQSPKKILALGEIIDQTLLTELYRHKEIEHITILSLREATFDTDRAVIWKSGSFGANMESLDGGFDAIIDLRAQKPNNDEARSLLANLAAEGILIKAFGTIEREFLKAYASCRYVIPYGFSTVAPFDGIVNGFVFASKKRHPVADLLLQKADMLEGVSYYSADTHNAAFAIPPYILARFDELIKN
jgi:spermidine synthase